MGTLTWLVSLRISSRPNSAVDHKDCALSTLAMGMPRANLWIWALITPDTRYFAVGCPGSDPRRRPETSVTSWLSDVQVKMSIEMGIQMARWGPRGPRWCPRHTRSHLPPTCDLSFASAVQPLSMILIIFLTQWYGHVYVGKAVYPTSYVSYTNHFN